MNAYKIKGTSNQIGAIDTPEPFERIITADTPREAYNANPEHHERTCNYWYLITKGGTSWTAFTTAEQLQNWMDVNGLKLTQELVPVGEFRSQKLVTK